MKRTMFLLAALVAPTLALANDNQAPGSNLILQVDETDNGDGSYTYDVYINPNVGPDPALYAYIETTVTGNLHQSYLEDPALIALNFWGANIPFLDEQQRLGVLDPSYDAAHDTVFNDDLFLGIVDLQLDPPGDGAPAGSLSQHVKAVNFIEFPHFLPGDDLTPIWHVTTWGRNLTVSGIVQTQDYPDGPFEWHIPEPATVLTGIIGTLCAVVSRRRRPARRVAC